MDVTTIFSPLHFRKRQSKKKKCAEAAKKKAAHQGNKGKLNTVGKEFRCI